MRTDGQRDRQTDMTTLIAAFFAIFRTHLKSPHLTNEWQSKYHTLYKIHLQQVSISLSSGLSRFVGRQMDIKGSEEYTASVFSKPARLHSVITVNITKLTFCALKMGTVYFRKWGSVVVKALRY